MNIVHIAAVIIAGYLLGAIPFAVIIARMHGVDIFKQGSGNPGATNVKRSVSSKAGNIVFLCDFLKGCVAALWPSLVFAGATHALPLGVWGLVAAILGHSFSVFIKFRGGKGVATAMGGLLALVPLILITGLIVWAILFYSSRYVSLGSIGFGISLPISGLVYGSSTAMILFLTSLAAIVVIRHMSNIKRLLAGTESRFEKKVKAS